jgi:transcriptional regulator with XRE-family HTH domain
VFNRLSREPEILGYRLARLREQAGVTPEQQAEALGISTDALAWLCKCTWPRTDRRAEDLAKHAGETGMGPARLAELLGVKDAAR